MKFRWLSLMMLWHRSLETHLHSAPQSWPGLRLVCSTKLCGHSKQEEDVSYLQSEGSHIGGVCVSASPGNNWLGFSEPVCNYKIKHFPYPDRILQNQLSENDIISDPLLQRMSLYYEDSSAMISRKLWNVETGWKMGIVKFTRNAMVQICGCLDMNSPGFKKIAQ